METLKEDRDTVDKAIEFIDGVSKTLEGLRDKYNLQIFDSESKNEKIDIILQSWVNQVTIVLQEKFEEIYSTKYSEELFKNCLKNWIIKFKDNQDFILNTKVLFKNLQHVRSTIKTKVTATDSLAYNNLTDMLINKSKNK